jgi:hypothetical protein
MVVGFEIRSYAATLEPGSPAVVTQPWYLIWGEWLLQLKALASALGLWPRQLNWEGYIWTYDATLDAGPLFRFSWS